MADAIRSEKLKLALELADLRQAITADVQALSLRNVAAFGLAGWRSRLLPIALGGVGAWLGMKLLKRVGLPATVGLFAATVLRPALQSWIARHLGSARE